MIKFFRKIRQQLLSQNRFSKYMLYAIGEIILVMVGILLALQVNNWNESRKLKQSDLGFITGLKNELIQDTIVINSWLNRYQDINLKIDSVLQLFKNSTLSHDEYNFIGATIPLSEYYVPLNIGTGQFDKTIDYQILNRINSGLSTEYADYLSEIKSAYEIASKTSKSLQENVQNRLYSRDKFMMNRHKTKREITVDYNFNSIKNDTLIINILSQSYAYRNGSMSMLKNLKNKANDLIELIEQELSNQQ